MQSRALTRSSKTLRLMALAYQHESKQPALTAITTLYSTLLTHAPHGTGAAWDQFWQVASLPLTAQRMVSKCQLDPDSPCTGYSEQTGGRCGHPLVQQSHTVLLSPHSKHRLERGVEHHANGQQQQDRQAMAEQLAQALGAA